MSRKSIFEQIEDRWSDQGFTRMAGTEQTFEYDVFVATMRGRAGLRAVGSLIRIRVEPVATGSETSASMRSRMSEILPASTGWKQPGHGGQDRWSITCAVSDRERCVELIRTAARALGLKDDQSGLKTIGNEAVPDWVRTVIDEMTNDDDRQWQGDPAQSQVAARLGEVA